MARCWFGTWATKLFAIVDAAERPLRVFSGRFPTRLVKMINAQRLQVRADWESLSIQAQGHPGEMQQSVAA